MRRKEEEAVGGGTINACSAKIYFQRGLLSFMFSLFTLPPPRK